MAFLGLAYPLLVGINAAFALIWIFWKSPRVLMPVLAIAVGYGNFGGLVAMNASDGSEYSASDIKLLSYNVRLFDLYNWKPGQTNRVGMLKMLEEEDADIICMQEYFYYDWKNPEFSFETRDTLLPLIKANNIHEEFLFNIHDKFRNENIHRIGMATYSRYPIVNKGSISFAEHTNNLALFSDLLIEGDTVRVYNVHLASVRLSKDEKEAADLLLEEEEGRTKRIVGKLKRAFERRAFQAETLRKHMDECPHPVILAGDFNDVATSYTYKQLSTGMLDAHREAGAGMGITYTEAFPGFRIDFVLHEPYWQALDCYTIDCEYSDHYPVITWLRPAAKAS